MSWTGALQARRRIIARFPRRLPLAPPASPKHPLPRVPIHSIFDHPEAPAPPAQPRNLPARPAVEPSRPAVEPARPAVEPARPAQRNKDPVRGAFFHFYHHGSAANHFFRRRIRPAGMGLLVAGIVVTFLAAGQTGGRGTHPVFQLFSLGFSLGLLSLAILPLRRGRLEVHRELPPHATAGEPLRLSYRVRNAGRRRLRNAWLCETAPDPRPGKARFLASREPGEETRNAFDRTFSYYRWNWLCEKRTAYDCETGPAIDLAPGESRTTHATLLPRRRGLVPLDDLRLLLPDPLGFFQRCVRTPAGAATLAVLPRRHRLPPFALPGSARFQPGGDATSRHAGPSGEFVGLRDYRPGDPPRLIHWKSWARTGRPIVKELEDTFFPRHGLVLDTFPEHGDEDLFEHAVSVAASFVAAVDTHECLIDLMFVAGREQVVTAGRGTGRAETLLEVLAGVEPAPEPAFDPLRRLVVRHAEDLAGCLAIFAGWSPDRARLLEQLRIAGIEVAAIVVCQQRPEATPPRVHFLEASSIARDLMNLPRQL